MLLCCFYSETVHQEPGCSRNVFNYLTSSPPPLFFGLFVCLFPRGKLKYSAYIKAGASKPQAHHRISWIKKHAVMSCSPSWMYLFSSDLGSSHLGQFQGVTKDILLQIPPLLQKSSMWLWLKSWITSILLENCEWWLQKSSLPPYFLPPPSLSTHRR